MGLMNDIDYLNEEQKKVLRDFRVAGGSAMFIVAFGAIFYHIVEKLSWLNSVYFTVITLTTVGYGDITPHTNAGKLFTIFYVLTGIGIIATFANLALRRALVRREIRRERVKRKAL